MTLADRAKQELAWRRAGRDLLWCAGQWWIAHPQGVRRWTPYPAQIDILRDWATGDDYLHLKARQVGFSTTVAFYAWWVAYFTEGAKVLLVSKGERESKLLLEKIKFGYKRLPEWMLEHPKAPRLISDTQSEMRFSNDSEIVSLPSASDPARGFTGRLVIVDEWAFLQNDEEAWASIEPVADVGGQIIGLSTANGVGNTFHTLWVNAMNGIPPFIPKFYGWDAATHRDDEWYERQRQKFINQPWLLHQEYPSDPDEAFIRSGQAVFDYERIKRFHEHERSDGKRRRLHVTDSGQVTWESHSDGEVTVYEEPLPRRMYTLGADVAEGLEHGDYSSAHVVDVVTGNVVATWHGHLDPDLFGREVYGLGTMYNSALVCVESNNHGQTTLATLRRMAYPRLWRRRAYNKTTKKTLTEYGFRTNRGSKPMVIDKLGTWIRESNALLPCRRTADELASYVRSGNGSMGGSPHDDRVMSLAFAVFMLDYAHQPEYVIEIDDTGTLDWHARRAEEMRITASPGGGIRPLRGRR